MSETAHGDLTELDLGQPKVAAICDALDVSETVADAATAQARRADFEYNINASGQAIAAAAVYFQCLLQNEKRTQQAVADAADVSKATIRNVYHEIAEAEGFDMTRANKQRESPTNDQSMFGRLLEVFR